MNIITTTHKIPAKIVAGLLMSQDMMTGVFGGSDPNEGEAVVFIIMSLELVVATRIFANDNTTHVFKSKTCAEMWNAVMAVIPA